KNQVPQQTLKELCELFLHSLNNPKACRREISTHTVSSLHENLAQNTELVQALLGFLLVDDSHSMKFEYNSHLQNITVDFILDSLTSLQKHHQTEAPFSQTVNLIYKILSIMWFDLDLQESELKHLCTKLFRASWVKGYISEEQVQASILRKQNAGLVN
ncbi:unnamed protein product, partial [Staurois parvus]